MTRSNAQTTRVKDAMRCILYTGCKYVYMLCKYRVTLGLTIGEEQRIPQRPSEVLVGHSAV